MSLIDEAYSLGLGDGQREGAREERERIRRIVQDEKARVHYEDWNDPCTADIENAYEQACADILRALGEAD